MVQRYGVMIVLLAGAFVLTAGGLREAPEPPLSPLQQLGKALFFDDLSTPNGMSCATCHAPEVGFTGADTSVNRHGGVYPGAMRSRYGNRKPSSVAYATLSPTFRYRDRTFSGGNFWDGRATGQRLGNAAADQALGPFLNPVEHNVASKRAVLQQIAGASYAELWKMVWGEPVRFGTEEEIETNYDRIGLSIASYEGSTEVNAFSSKYDFYLKGQAELSEVEARGLKLFNGKGRCGHCHPAEARGNMAPLFTTFTYENAGTPKNPENPFYRMGDVRLADGSVLNPDGAAWVDKGLGGFLETHEDPEWRALAERNMGKHKVPTLRNVARRPSPGFPKAYMHNGVFKSVEQVVHFYNTRDVETWAAPEVAENVNRDEIGDLKLTPDEEQAIVAFLETLSDGYVPEKVQ